MALRNIRINGDPILHLKSRSVERFDEKLGELLDDMQETMYKAEGCGLAAVQVGVLKRVVVIDTGSGLIELVNPKVVDRKGVQHEIEGCLSIPGESGITERPQWVKVQAQNRKGEAIELEGEGLLARAFCHEIDHLDGHLFLERLVEEDKRRKLSKKKF